MSDTDYKSVLAPYMAQLMEMERAVGAVNTHLHGIQQVCRIPSDKSRRIQAVVSSVSNTLSDCASPVVWQTARFAVSHNSGIVPA